MTYLDFLTRVIDDGIAAAKADYGNATPLDRAKAEGSVEGFEACRGKSPSEILELLSDAGSRILDYRINHDQMDLEAYWRLRCRQLEIEWVANCVSAMLYNEGQTPIVPPTVGGMFKAAEVLGVKEEGSV